MSRGVQVGTIDALLIQLCRRNDLTLLTTDQGFHAAIKQVEFRLWSSGYGAQGDG
jgi:predicted nucleic acid-binding protein